MKLIPAFPYKHLDGTPWKGCEHHNCPKTNEEKAVIEGVGKAIIAAGIPDVIVRIGQTVETTWGCARNKKKTTRKAEIYEVEVALVRHPQSMFFVPQIFYYARDSKFSGMVLEDFTAGNLRWSRPTGERIPITFRLEWINVGSGLAESVDGSGVHFISNLPTTESGHV